MIGIIKPTDVKPLKPEHPRRSGLNASLRFLVSQVKAIYEFAKVIRRTKGNQRV